MFEVIVTSRSDFSEVPIGRYRTEEEAQEKAQQIAVRYYRENPAVPGFASSARPGQRIDANACLFRARRDCAARNSKMRTRNGNC